MFPIFQIPYSCYCFYNINQSALNNVSCIIFSTATTNVKRFTYFVHMYVFFSGFLEKEIKKDGIPMLDTGDNPDAPAPREMIDLEVCLQLKLFIRFPVQDLTHL